MYLSICTSVWADVSYLSICTSVLGFINVKSASGFDQQKLKLSLCLEQDILCENLFKDVSPKFAARYPNALGRM